MKINIVKLINNILSWVNILASPYFIHRMSLRLSHSFWSFSLTHTNEFALCLNHGQLTSGFHIELTISTLHTQTELTICSVPIVIRLFCMWVFCPSCSKCDLIVLNISVGMVLIFQFSSGFGTEASVPAAQRYWFWYFNSGSYFSIPGFWYKVFSGYLHMAHFELVRLHFCSILAPNQVEPKAFVLNLNCSKFLVP